MCNVLLCCAPRVSALAGCYRNWYQSRGYSEHRVLPWRIQAITPFHFKSSIFLEQLVWIKSTSAVVIRSLITYVLTKDGVRMVSNGMIREYVLFRSVYS